MSEPTPKRRRGASRILGPILRYSLPQKRTIALVFVLMGVYALAGGLRVGIVGLVLDGVVAPKDASAEKGRAVQFFEARILPFLPAEAGLSSSYTTTERTVELTIRRGTPDPEREPVETPEGWRSRFVNGAADFTTSSGATVTGATFDSLVVIHEVALGDATPTPEAPIVVGDAVVKLSRSEGEGGSIFALLASIAVIGMVLSLVIAAANFGREYLALKVQVHTVAALRADIFRHLSRLGLDFFSGRRSGDLISRLTNDVGTVQQSLRYIFGDLIQHPLTVLTMLGVAFAGSPVLTLVVLPFFPILLIPIIRSGRKVKRHGRGSLRKLGEVTESMGQLLSGIRVVKAFGLEKAQWREFDDRNAGFVRSSLRMTRAKVTARSVLEGLYNLMAAGAILFGGWVITRNFVDVTIGDFGIFLGGITGLYQPLKAMTRIYNTISESAAGAERILDLLDETPTIADRPDAAAFPPFSNSIRFDNVAFRYGPEEPWVLRDIDFEVRKGETIALVGPSGAGKSTLLDLLPRFHDPVEGAILIDGRDLREGTNASLLEKIAIVGQDPFLFHTTIGENIRGGRAGATDDEVRAAAAAASIADEIEAMPEGYDTVIGERGVKLSGGQRQRVTIARAILKNADILILDEATSALDTESERKVQAALDRLVEGRTTFVIAHRLSTIQHADRILVLESGRIVERGTHEELAARDGVYARLLRMQEISDEPPAARATATEETGGRDRR